jgi:hypothetical protein
MHPLIVHQLAKAQVAENRRRARRRQNPSLPRGQR